MSYPTAHDHYSKQLKPHLVTSGRFALWLSTGTVHSHSRRRWRWSHLTALDLFLSKSGHPQGCRRCQSVVRLEARTAGRAGPQTLLAKAAPHCWLGVESSTPLFISATSSGTAKKSICPCQFAAWLGMASLVRAASRWAVQPGHDACILASTCPPAGRNTACHWRGTAAWWRRRTDRSRGSWTRRGSRLGRHVLSGFNEVAVGRTHRPRDPKLIRGLSEPILSWFP